MGYFKEIKDNFIELRAGSRDIQEKLRTVQDEAFKAQRIEKSIERSISEFQFSAQGHIDKINKTLDKYNAKEKSH